MGVYSEYLSLLNFMIYFSNSGSEANDGAIKLAKYATERPAIITFINAFHVVIITSELRFEALKDALEKVGITGMTVTRVLGFGLQKGHTDVYRGSKVKSRLLPKVKIELIVSAIPTATIVDVTKKILYTGRYGDGKIFIYDVENVIKIRTGEEGYNALQDYPIS